MEVGVQGSVWTRIRGQAVIDGFQSDSLNRWREAAATRFDCCLSQEILDGDNGLLTT